MSSKQKQKPKVTAEFVLEVDLTARLDEWGEGWVRDLAAGDDDEGFDALRESGPFHAEMTVDWKALREYARWRLGEDWENWQEQA